MNNIKIDKFNIRDLINNEAYIPDFQRSYVWKYEKQEELIYSLINGYPIGIILFFETKDKSLLIDGLQRLSTIKLFDSKPSEIFSTSFKFEKFYEQTGVGKKLSYIMSGNEDIIKPLYKEWFNSIGTSRDLSKLLSFTTWSELQKLTAKLNKEDSADELIELIYNTFKKTIDITYYQLPVMFYKGTEEEMPIIFSKINTNSQVLTQYEVYSALWNDKLLMFNDENMEIIRELDKGKIQTIEGEKRPIINIFKSLAFRLEKIDKEIFGKKKIVTGNQLYSIAYEIYSVLFLDTNNKIGDFIENLEIKEETAKFLQDINDIVCTVFEEIYNEIKTNEYGDEYYTKNIILYYISLKIKSKYSIDLINQTIKLDKIEIPVEYCGSLDLINKNGWFKDVNRQITFFREKCADLSSYTEAIRCKKAININSKGKFIVGEINTTPLKDFSLLDNKGYAFLKNLSDVNNEPYNKRIQGDHVKAQLDTYQETPVSAIYTIKDTDDFLLVNWILTKEDVDNLKNCVNPSLKVSIHDIKKAYNRKLSTDLISTYKYAYKVMFVSTVDGQSKIID